MQQFHEKILIVEDDPQIRSYMSYALKSEGFLCETAGNAKGALHKLATESVDILILDLGLPDYDGMEVIRQVREWSEIPIVVVSARDQDKEKVAALDLGADDYLTKPFSTTEFLARIRVALRHRHSIGQVQEQFLYQVGELELDIEHHQIKLQGERVHLTPMEFNLMILFMKNAGKVLTTAYIRKEIWGITYETDTQALRTLMAGVRRKIEKNPAKPRYILTEMGVGYRMAVE